MSVHLSTWNFVSPYLTKSGCLCKTFFYVISLKKKLFVIKYVVKSKIKNVKFYLENEQMSNIYKILQIRCYKGISVLTQEKVTNEKW